ncbi:unnamed protein product [Lactuca saligna]|uniref:Replication protein A 70 kDa DNA-binding subunit B/D first OB fold domain-containing protein n=1 Tax=Lactuca saligna TaxID=75948 RepID=A0AA35VB45_LACSI|nr:unnamed protein product [Lactuca saligna]
MAAPNITFISDMDVTRDDLTFKLRIINLWHQMSFYNKSENWSIEMILLDEHGNKIQAMVSKRNLYRFKNVVKDKMTFYIKGPNFAALKTGSFKLTPNDQKFRFVQQNVVTECNNFSGSLFGFSFVDYQAVLSLTHPQDTSIDRPSVNTYFTSSMLFINSDIDEITNFNKSLDGDDCPDSSTNTFSIIPSNQISTYDDFMVKNNLKGIAEDVVSGTDDNITPSTIEKNGTTSAVKILNTTPVLKQNLEEVFDLEIIDHLSISKTPKICPDGLGKQLLKVKLEKND